MIPETYMLIATKSNDGGVTDTYYIANTNPIIWTENKNNAKIFVNRYSAECNILRDYDNYTYIKKQINNGLVDNVYLVIMAGICEIRREKIL